MIWYLSESANLAHQRMAASSKLTNSFPRTRIFCRSQVTFNDKRFLKMTVNSKFITVRIIINRVA